jgi:GTPase SAR1 family protein
LSGIHFPSLPAETITAGLDQAKAHTSATLAHSTTEQHNRQNRHRCHRRRSTMANSLEAKIVVLGSQGVGKTSFVHRYVKNAFAPPSTQSTIGASFLTKRVIDVDTSTVVRLQIWDTAGQERFRSISKLYYRGMSPSMQSR